MDRGLYSFLDGVAENGKMRTIPLVRDDVAALLWSLAPRGPGSRVLELGTGMGYSSAVIAGAMGLVERVPEVPYAFTEPSHRQALASIEALGTDGAGGARIVTVDRDPRRIVEANRLFGMLGMPGMAVAVYGECPGILHGLDGVFDLIFIDAGKSENREYVQVILDKGLLASNGLIVVDNLGFKGGGDTPRARRIRGNISGFVDWFRGLGDWDVVRLPIGDGILLASRQES